MKFTAEQVLEKLKTKLGQTQKLSDRTILDIVKNTMTFLPADSEMELDEFFAKVQPNVETTNANFNHEQGVFIQEYAKKNPLSKPEEAKGGLTPEQLVDVLQKANAPLLARIEAQNAEIAAIKGAKSKETALQNGLAEFMKSKPDPARQAIIDKAYKTVSANMGEDVTPETFATALKAEYDELVSISGVVGYVPAEGSGGNADNDAQAMAKEIERLKQTMPDKFPAKAQ